MKFRELLKRLKVPALVAALGVMLTGCDERYVVFNPAGPVGREELHLIVLSAILVAIVIIPVLAILAYIVFRYRDKPGNTAPYKPNWEHNTKLEFVWWGIPILIIAVLGYYTTTSTFSLAKPPTTDVKPVVIQVTSLDWKWMFQYPDQGVATVNYVNIPAGVPVQFELTADAPMNSFWVPQLGGQEYAMPGMAMRLWLQADKPGVYDGTGANFSGEGFAHMNFKVNAKPQAEFDQWVKDVKAKDPVLTKAGYEELKKPGTAETATYSAFPAGLFKETVDKNGGIYMKHQEEQMNQEMKDMPGMDMSNSSSK